GDHEQQRQHGGHDWPVDEELGDVFHAKDPRRSRCAASVFFAPPPARQGEGECGQPCGVFGLAVLACAVRESAFGASPLSITRRPWNKAPVSTLRYCTLCSLSTT